jgi:hypothetical protein
MSLAVEKRHRNAPDYAGGADQEVPVHGVPIKMTPRTAIAGTVAHRYLRRKGAT